MAIFGKEKCGHHAAIHVRRNNTEIRLPTRTRVVALKSDLNHQFLIYHLILLTAGNGHESVEGKSVLVKNFGVTKGSVFKKSQNFDSGTLNGDLRYSPPCIW